MAQLWYDFVLYIYGIFLQILIWFLLIYLKLVLAAAQPANNLDKAANLEMLGRNVPDELVLDQAFKKISDSISKNKQAKNAPKAPTPIRQIESDRQDGYGGNGEMSVRDWQKILTV